MTNRYFIFAGISILSAIVSCQKTKTNKPIEGETLISVMCYKNDETKTKLTENVLSWSSGDKIGLFAEEKQTNRPFINESGNKFSGSFISGKQAAQNVEYVAYYPYNAENSGSIITSELSTSQVAPFDASMDCMVSDIVLAPYDESDMPALSFSFSNHLFSILKISLKNTSGSMKNEKITKIVLSSESSPLAGKYSFDVADGGTAIPVFSTASNEVTVAFSSSQAPVLSTDKVHSIYAIVRTGTISDLTLKVFTTNNVGKASSSTTIELENGVITSLPLIDYSKMLANLEASIPDLGEKSYESDSFWK